MFHKTKWLPLTLAILGSAQAYALELDAVAVEPDAVTTTADNQIFRDGFDGNEPPAGRFTSSHISYVPSTGAVRFNVPLTEYENVWGHATAVDGTVAFPGRGNSQPILIDFPRGSYACLHFRTADVVTQTARGWISRTDYNYSADLTSSISTLCGDFNPPDVACKAITPGGTFPQWQTGATGNRCHLVPGVDYYLNFKLTDPTQSTTSCNGLSPVCSLGTSNNFLQ